MDEDRLAMRIHLARTAMGWTVKNNTAYFPCPSDPRKVDYVFLTPDLGPTWAPDHNISDAWDMLESLRAWDAHRDRDKHWTGALDWIDGYLGNRAPIIHLPAADAAWTITQAVLYALQAGKGYPLPAPD